VFARQRVAVFVDGCFWHGCPEHITWPKANGNWWRTKINATAARDRRNDAALTDAGWTVVRIWEHESAASAADRVQAMLHQERPETTAVDEAVTRARISSCSDDLRGPHART
jgi:DNA mismatch endonuclease (patch repair protein)